MTHGPSSGNFLGGYWGVGHITHSRVTKYMQSYEESLFMKKREITVKFQMKSSTKKINGIILGDMTRHVVFLNPQYSEACYKRVLLNFVKSINSEGQLYIILCYNFRCVMPEDKSFAQGLVLVLVSLLAFIPGPIIFGSIIGG